MDLLIAILAVIGAYQVAIWVAEKIDQLRDLRMQGRRDESDHLPPGAGS